MKADNCSQIEHLTFPTWFFKNQVQMDRVYGWLRSWWIETEAQVESGVKSQMGKGEKYKIPYYFLYLIKKFFVRNKVLNFVVHCTKTLSLSSNWYPKKCSKVLFC